VSPIFDICLDFTRILHPWYRSHEHNKSFAVLRSLLLLFSQRTSNPDQQAASEAVAVPGSGAVAGSN
jgi:hypothetical protein